VSSITFAISGFLPDTLSASAQDMPLPQKQPALIDTSLPTSVLDILMRQDQAIKKKQQDAQKAAALKAASLSKKSNKKNKTRLNSEGALPSETVSTAKSGKKEKKSNATPGSNVGLPIAIQNRIDDLSADPMPELRLATEPVPASENTDIDVLPLRGMTASLSTVSSKTASTLNANAAAIPALRLNPATVETAASAQVPSLQTTPASTSPFSSLSFSNLPGMSNATTGFSSPSNIVPSGALNSAPARADGLKAKTALYLDNLNDKFQAWKEKPREPIPDHVRNIFDAVINTSHEIDRNGRPLHYEALSGIAIFPVIRHGEEKAFGDIPLLFAREYSNKLASVVSPETHIYNPIYTVESIKQKGIGAIYDQMMEYYIRSGRPDPKATNWLLKQVTENGYPISRVMFVESDIDMNNPEASTGLKDRVQALLMDATPRHIKMMVKSRVQVFDVENPNMPRLWGGSWQRSVDFSSVRNITKSVYDDTDSERSFSSTSRRISQELLYAMPRNSYMIPVYDTGVHAEVLKTENSNESSSMETSIKPVSLNRAWPNNLGNFKP